ncbi:MAG TPA: CdaR family protein [Polyangiaceae bacterium]|nr:CdaR family protein [Polyangiaceae bacterium]
MKRRKTGLMNRLLRWTRAALTENLGLKIFSFVLALGLAAYQRGSEDEQQRTLAVDVIVRLPAAEAHRELMTLVPQSIHVTVRGSTRAIDQLIQSSIPPVEVDLRQGDASAITFKDDMFSLPPGVKINIIDPSTIKLEWQNVIERNVPIQASVTGPPAAGYTVQNVKVDPSSIPVEGPASLVEVMQFVRVAAFDVSGKTDGVYKHRLKLDPPGQLTEYLGPASAVVEVTIARQLVQRKFTKRTVIVLGPGRVKTEPAGVDVSVTGPPELINGLRDEMVVPRVDLAAVPAELKDQHHGSTVLPVHVDLARVEIEIQPPTVTVIW